MKSRLKDELCARTLPRYRTFVGMLLLSLATTAGAVSISGEIGFGGNFVPVDGTWAQTGTASATGIDFDPNLMIVSSATGDFAGASFLGSIVDFQFDPSLGINDGFGGVTTVASITDFWTIDGFSFELTSAVPGFTNDPNQFLVLEGAGTITAAGFDPTPGTWDFTGDTTNGGTFTWSAGTTVAVVPLPAAIWLFASGLIALIGTKFWGNYHESTL